ncbi:MAG TPA: MBL fold metallo-hydrolase [Actinomycetota bacterium]|nr:MBL fold metallo-hydrolase [Actinomycetota bacterium]
MSNGGLQVVVLGASGTFPVPDLAASGFLIQAGDTNVWLDAGTGTFANLQRHIAKHDITAVILSHTHLDHFLDIYPLYYALRYAEDSRGATGLEVFGPDGTREAVCALIREAENPEDCFDGYLSFRKLSPGGQENIGGVDFSFANTIHPTETLAVRAQIDGRVLGYTADTGPDPNLATFFSKADCLIAEASTLTKIESLAEVHMSAEEAGRLAAEAEAGKLVLTHVTPGLDPQESVRIAAKEFSGEILVARDNLVVEI